MREASRQNNKQIRPKQYIYYHPLCGWLFRVRYGDLPYITGADYNNIRGG
jgi:hypothetical protein